MHTKKAKTSGAAMIGMSLLLIFITAMNYPPDKKEYTFLALGDSYTIGEMVPAADNFPNQVQHLMAEKGIGMKKPEIIAKTGWTTNELQAAIYAAAPGKQYDFVSLLIGVNNQYRGRSVEEYKPEFEKLLQQAIGFAGDQPSHVIVLSIPDWGATPFAAGRDREQISREIDAYNNINKELATHYHVNYLDITPGTRKAMDDPSLLATDGLHPSGKEYQKWAKAIAGIILEKI